MVKYSITYVNRNISNTGGGHHEKVQPKNGLWTIDNWHNLLWMFSEIANNTKLLTIDL